MPRRKAGKRARKEDRASDVSRPVAKHMSQLNLKDPSAKCEEAKSNDSSTDQLMSNIEIADISGQEFSWPSVVPPLGGNSCTDMEGHALAYEPDIPAADNPHYYDTNRTLFEAHLLWVQRQQSSTPTQPMSTSAQLMSSYL